MTTSTTFILRALNAEGVEFFYTGRAGSGWVSQDADEAFPIESLDGARRRAMQHNEWTALHGLWFLAIDRERSAA